MKDLKIIAVVGMSGAGKSVAVDYLTRRGTPKVHFGNMIYREMDKRGIPITPDSQREFREMIRATEGQDWVVRQAITEINDLIAAGQKRIVLDGLYSWTEYRALKHAFPGNELTVIAIVAPRTLRYDRVAHRPERPFNAQEIRARDYSEIEKLEKGAPIAMADYYVLNDRDIEHLESQLKSILQTIHF